MRKCVFCKRTRSVDVLERVGKEYQCSDHTECWSHKLKEMNL